MFKETNSSVKKKENFFFLAIFGVESKGGGKAQYSNFLVEKVYDVA